MTRHWTRRGALRTLASLGIGAVMVGCGSGNGSDGEIETTVEPIANADRARGDGAANRLLSGAPRGRRRVRRLPDDLSCILTPEQIEGPYFLDTGLLRRDIAEDRVGIPLRLDLRLAAVAGESCEPLRGALVEVWHADAEGAYSGYTREQGNVRDAAGETFLRGYQVSNDRGAVRFSTIYPGWYPLRTVHIHLMVRLGSNVGATIQIYFPDEVNDAVLSQPPYDAHGQRSIRNASDFIVGPRLEDLICEVVASGDGYVARYSLGIAV